MKKLLISPIALLLCFNAFSQTGGNGYEMIEELEPIEIPPPMEVPEDEIYKIVETMPVFPGGQDSLMQYLAKVPFDPIATDGGIEGTTYVQFIVERDGSISNAVVARSCKNEQLDQVAVNHVLSMPKWAPGMQRGKPVRLQFVVPIRFKK